MNIDKVKYLIHLIEKERTGSPREFAQKLNVSERTIYFHLSILKNELKAPIIFNKFRNTYQFERKGKLNWEWTRED